MESQIVYKSLASCVPSSGTLTSGLSLLLSKWLHYNKNEGYGEGHYAFVLLFVYCNKRANAVNHKPSTVTHSMGEEVFANTSQG